MGFPVSWIFSRGESNNLTIENDKELIFNGKKKMNRITI